MLIENLENRRLFAVTVEVTNGVLTITGDESDNLASVHLSDEDTLVVRTATRVEDETEETEETEEIGRCGPYVDWGEITTEEASRLVDLGFLWDFWYPALRSTEIVGNRLATAMLLELPLVLGRLAEGDRSAPA